MFDEAQMATPAVKTPLAVQALQQLGHHKNESWVTEENKKQLSTADKPLWIQKLSATAKNPEKGST